MDREEFRLKLSKRRKEIEVNRAAYVGATDPDMKCILEWRDKQIQTIKNAVADDRNLTEYEYGEWFTKLGWELMDEPPDDEQ